MTTEKLKTELIDLFNLEGVDVSEIGDNDHLFHDGLGLDSVDAIELTIFLDNTYGIVFPNIAASEQAFRSIQSLYDYINAHGNE